MNEKGNPPAGGSFEKTDYEGATPSTLCAGCGHDQISRHIIRAFYSEQINPFETVKISGIGCSSKTPAYFLKKAQGFNTVHGRMAPVAFGVKIANRSLKVIGVSGDGDTGSIGLGAFLHTAKQNIPMIYIVENNGVYGLTKGQFSATAQKGGYVKSRGYNPRPALDLCRLALSAGCGFVARSFSGDGKQLVSLLKLALKFKGFAFIDVISPCVAYGNEREFPHSFPSMKEHNVILNKLDIIEGRPPVQVDFKEGESQKIPLPDGSCLILRKLKDHDPKDYKQALEVLNFFPDKKTVVTGLIYHSEKKDFFQNENITERTLVSLKEKNIRLSEQNLQSILTQFA